MMRIFAPNLYLCAYHLRKDNTQGETHSLWENCDRLLSHFTPKQLSPQLHLGEHRILLPPPQTEINFNLSDESNLEGFIQPVQLQDSYGVFFNIGYDEENDKTEDVNLESLQQFNPENRLLFPFSSCFLGETLILTVWLTRQTRQQDLAYLRQLANGCYQHLFNCSDPPLSRRGDLFGSSIFEYGNPREPAKSPQVLIWLFRDEIADQTLQNCFLDIFDLFFYRHKVVKAFYDSRHTYQKLKQYYDSLDPTLDDIQDQLDRAEPNPQDSTYLQDFKTQLKKLSTDSLSYDRILRKMKDLLTTIHINCNNYNSKIERICAILETDKEELSFLRYFGEETAPQFQQQIEADLRYFDQGTGLIRQAIASIRAIVEIDQAQCDRTWQRWEKKRDQRQQELQKKAEANAQAEQERQQQANQDLQDQIQAVGVGIAAGAIVASTSGLATEPWQLPSSDRPWLPPHPFVIALLASVICSLGGWWITKTLIQKRRSPPPRTPNE